MSLWAEAEKIGRERMACKRKVSKRFYENPNEEYIVGVWGELYFQKRYSDLGAVMDKRLLTHGDDGWDFDIRGIKIDVKTLRRRYPNVLVKQKEISKPVDVYVFLRQIGKESGVFLGWETRKHMANQPFKDTGRGIVNHYKPHKELRWMEELVWYMKFGYMPHERPCDDERRAK